MCKPLLDPVTKEKVRFINVDAAGKAEMEIQFHMDQVKTGGCTLLSYLLDGLGLQIWRQVVRQPVKPSLHGATCWLPFGFRIASLHCCNRCALIAASCIHQSSRPLQTVYGGICMLPLPFHVMCSHKVQRRGHIATVDVAATKVICCMQIEQCMGGTLPDAEAFDYEQYGVACQKDDAQQRQKIEEFLRHHAQQTGGLQAADLKGKQPAQANGIPNPSTIMAGGTPQPGIRSAFC